MTEFSTKAMLEVQPDESSLRDARNTIEERVGSVRTQVATDGGRPRSSGLNADRVSSDNSTLSALLEQQNEHLSDIHDELKKLGTSGFGGGGGGGGGFLSGLGLATAANKGKGALGTLGGLLGGIGLGGGAAIGGGLLAGFGGAAGLEKVRQDSSWSPLQDVMNRGEGSGSKRSLSDLSGEEVATLGGDGGVAPSLGQVGEAFNIEKPRWMENPFEGWSNPLQDWTMPDTLSSLDWSNPLSEWSVPSDLQTGLSWENPLEEWSIPSDLQSGLDWSNPFEGWSAPDWLTNPGGNGGGPLISGFQPEKGDFIPGDGPMFNSGSKGNKAKRNQMPQVNVDLSPQLDLNARTIEQALSNAMGSRFVKDVADEIQRDVMDQVGF